MNKKRLGKFIAVSSIFVVSSVTGIIIAGCDGCNKHEHNLTEVSAVAPTCTKDGNDAYYVCGDCGHTFSDAEGKTEIAVQDTLVEKLGHDFTHHTEEPATCTSPGTIEYWECTRCDELFSDADGKNAIETVEYYKDHSWGETGHHAQVDPTTEKDGTLQYWECQDCHNYFADEFGDREVTLEELKMDRVSENIDGALTTNFYPTENALIIGGTDVEQGGTGIIINAVTARDGVYLHIVVNYDEDASQQPSGFGKIGLYFNVRNSENLNLPGGAGDCLAQAMLMELYLNGSVAYHNPYLLKNFKTTENEDANALTKFTTTWEMFIPHSGFATVNNGVFAEGFETVENKTVLKSGYTYMITAIGAMHKNETFEDSGDSQCKIQNEAITWAFWSNKEHGDWDNSQKYYVLSSHGITKEFQRATDTYKVNVNDYSNAQVTGLDATVDYDDKLQGTVTVDDGYRLSGIIVNGQIFTFKPDGANTYNYEIAVEDITTLKWNDIELTVEVVITKLEYQPIEITLQGVKGGKTENIAQGTTVTLTSIFGDQYTVDVGEDGKAKFGEDVICMEYTVKIDGYNDVLLTVVKGEPTAQAVLEYHFAHNAGTRPDLVDLTDMNAANASITLGAKGENGLNGKTPSGEDNVISVQLNLTEEMKNADAYVLYTTVTVNGEIMNNTGVWLQRFAIRFAEGGNNSYNNKFVIWWDDLGLNSNPSAIWATDATYCGGAQDREPTYDWLASAVLDGLQIKLVRNGSYVTISVYDPDEDEWITLLSGTTSSTAKNDITFFVSGESFTFSELSYEVLEYVERVLPENDKAGMLEHFVASNGDIFLLNGTLAKEAELLINIASNVNVNISAYEKDGETEVTLENGTEILLIGKFDTYRYIVGETVITEMLEDEYEAFLYGYGKVKFTATSGADINIDLIETAAYPTTDKVTVDQTDGTISIEAQPKNDAKNWTGGAEIVIPQDIGTYVVFETTIKMGDTEEGWNGHSTEQRYVIQMTESGKGFYLWSWKDGDSKTCVRELVSLTNCMTEGELVNGNESGNGWIYDAIVSESGLQLRVIRLGDNLILTAIKNDAYTVIGTLRCGADDATKIVVYGVTASFEFSDYSAIKLTYVEKDATTEEDGYIAHYTDGVNYYKLDGTLTTKEAVTIPKIVEKTVEITVEIYDKDGNKITDADLSDVKISLIGEYAYNNDVYTELGVTSGVLELDDNKIFEGAYWVIANGYAVDAIEIDADTTTVTLKLYQISSYQVVEAEKTYRSEDVEFGFNENGVTIKLNAHNDAEYADWACPVPEATLNLSDEILSSKSVAVEFNLKASNGGFWASNCFGLQMVNGYNGFMFYFSGFNLNDITIYQLHGQKLRENDDQLGALVGQYGWVEELALGANGVNLRAVRTGTVITLYAQNSENAWINLGTLSCELNAKTEIKFMGSAADFEISNIVVCTAPAAITYTDGSIKVSDDIVYHEYVAPSESNDYIGNVEYYTVGDAYYLTNGTKTTAAGVIIAEVEVYITVSAADREGNTIELEDGTEIVLSGEIKNYVFTVGGTLEKMIAGKYKAYLDGYGILTVVVGDNGGDISIDLVESMAVATVGTHGGNSGVTVDDENNSITITGNGLFDDNKTWAGSAELNLLNDIESSKNVVLYFNLKLSNEHTGAWDWAARRFGVTMQGEYGGIMSFTPTADEASLYQMDANLEAKNGEVALNELAALIRSEDGINMQVIRLGDRIVVNVEVDGDWEFVGEFECDGDDATKIVFYAEGDTFVFSDIEVSEYTEVDTTI